MMLREVVTERVNKLMAAQVASLWRHVQLLEKQMRKLMRASRKKAP